MLAFFMGEEPEDPLLLQQPRDKIEVAFLILQTVFTLRRFAFQLELVVGKSAVLKHLLDNFLRVEVLKNAVVAGERQPPQPGAQHKLIAIGVAGRRKLARLGNQPVIVGIVDRCC